MPPLAFKADRRDHNQTLAAVLKARYGLSWSKAKTTIERRHVRVSGQIVADAAYRVKAGKRITVAVGAIEHPAEKSPEPVKPKDPVVRKERPTVPRLPIEIVYSDSDLVVVNKPAGLTTSRSAEDRAEFGAGQRYLPDTLADKIPGLLGERRAKVIAVHRIDQGTSGLVVFARTKAAAEHLTRQFKAHSVERVYQALVRGTPPMGKIESTLVDDRGDGRRGSGEGGKRAVTHVTVMESYPQGALVECRLETGRTHQVRIHLGEAGAPLCGERVYDRPVNGAPLPDPTEAARPMLHAAVLGFEHPSRGDTLRFQIDPPRDFQTVRNHLAAMRSLQL